MSPKELKIDNITNKNGQENTPNEFRWLGNIFYVLSGDHTFRFEPSKVTPGGTTFVNSEVPLRLNVVLLRLVPIGSKFEHFCQSFKARVEHVKKEGRASA